MEVKEHMSATQLKEILNERKHLNPKRVETLQRLLREDLESLSPSTTFKEAYYVFYIEEAIFYGIGGSVSSLNYVFLNRDFIVNVDIRHFDSITLSFNGNSGKPTEQDKREVVNQLFDIIENAEVFLLEDMTRHNTTIEFTGV